MSTFTHVSGNTTTLAAASAALARLDQLSLKLDEQLQALPQPGTALLDAVAVGDTSRLAPHINALLQEVDYYWAALDTTGKPRHVSVAISLEQALRDEVTLKVHEGDLEAHYEACLPTTDDHKPDDPVSVFSLHVQFDEQESVEIAGALVMCHNQGLTLLALPGTGMLGFVSRSAMSETISRWLNDSKLKSLLINNAEQRYQDRMNAIQGDPELFLPPFQATDVQLQAVTENPFRYQLSRQRHKQREDVRHACAKAINEEARRRPGLIRQALLMTGLFGPTAILELRELAYMESQQRKHLPQWVKLASNADLQACQKRLLDYDLARTALFSTLEGAESPEQFADIRLRTRLATDLGYDLNPQDLVVSTRRTLPLTHESYTVSHSLRDLALYGLHPGDSTAGSAFLTGTTLSLDNAPLGNAYPLLTPSYIAGLVDELNLRVTFGDFQRKTYGQQHKQELARDLIRKNIAAQAYTARMQGHLLPGDFAIVESLSGSGSTTTDNSLTMQQIKLNGQVTLSNLLVFRKDDAQGHADRLVLFAADAPNGQAFKGFHNETQLLHELVGWSASEQMTTYLLEQVRPASRLALQTQLEQLRLKPVPPKDFLQLVSQRDYGQAVHGLLYEQMRVVFAEQANSTPAWLIHASPAQRQELLALEEAARAAEQNYQGTPHTHVQDFENYVHERATQKINTLLGLADGQVDPDLIIITSQRETLTYTQMLRNGYNDSVDLLTTSADTEATFSGPAGIDLSPLTPLNVARSVHGKWLADDYVAKIRTTLLDPESTGYTYRRQTSLLINQLQMQAAALRSLLKRHISSEQYQWLRASLDKLHLSDGSTRKDYPLFPLQIHVDKPLIASQLSGIDQVVVALPNIIHIETVQGCLVVLPVQVRQAALLYTPQAPDGVEYRLFSDFVASLQKPGMIDYYKDRCRLEARRTLAFFLNDMKAGGANKPPFIPKDGFSDLYDICFNRPLERKIRDVEETTTGRHDMLARLSWTSFELIITVLTLPFPPASFAVGALLAFHDSVQAVKALTQGKLDEAGAYILASVLNSLGAAGDLHSGLKGFGGVIHKLKPRHGRTALARSAKQLTPPPRYRDLYPAQLAGETFWRGKANSNGHAPLFRAAPTQDVQPTGQFTRQDGKGTWQPLAYDASPSTTQPIAANVSLSSAKPVDTGHAKGVSVLNGKHYIELNGATHQVQFDARLRHWNIIDPANPFAFFGKKPVHLDAQGKWQLSDGPGLRGGMERYSPLPSQQTPMSEFWITRLDGYQLPENMRNHIYNMLEGRVGDDPILEEYFARLYGEMRRQYVAMRENLYSDAQRFFAAPDLLPRPVLPKLEADAAFEEILPLVFRQTNGLVISEAAKSVASKRLLIENMVSLAEQDVKVLYIEHLFTDMHLQKLAKYRKLASSSRAGSHEIREHLRFINSGNLDNGSAQYDYYHLIKAAHRHSIEIRPFSSVVSYPHAKYPVSTATGDPAAAQKMSNFFGDRLIAGDIQAHPNRRWVALLDQELANTCNGVPGIAELEGAISVRVVDVPSDYPMQISRDIDGTQVDGVTVQSDFRLQVANPHMAAMPAAAQTTAAPVASRLDVALSIQLEGRSAAANGSAYVGDHGFIRDGATGWKRVAPQDWASDTSPTAIQQSLMDATYEIPADLRSPLHELINFERRGLHPDYNFARVDYLQAREAFFTRSKLLQDNAAASNIALPARPVMPKVATDIALPDFLDTLYQHTDGIVIGEEFSSIASKKLIIDNLPKLAKQEVKTLYMGHLLSDLHQADLDRFFDTGHMSKTLLHDLNRLDIKHSTDAKQIYTYQMLVLGARAHGLEIRAIDCATSYHIKSLRSHSVSAREELMNYFSSRTMGKHQEVMGSHKWIALVGNTRANTFMTSAPGLAELEGAIGVQVLDVLPGNARGVLSNPGAEPIQIGGQSVIVRCNYRVELETLSAGSAARPRMPLPVEQRIAKPGMFLVEEGEDGQQVIVHRSRDNAIHRTPVVVDSDGKVSVQRPSWMAVHGKVYDNMDALFSALEGINLKRMA